MTTIQEFFNKYCSTLAVSRALQKSGADLLVFKELIQERLEELYEFIEERLNENDRATFACITDDEYKYIYSLFVKKEELEKDKSILKSVIEKVTQNIVEPGIFDRIREYQLHMVPFKEAFRKDKIEGIFKEGSKYLNMTLAEILSVVKPFVVFDTKPDGYNKLNALFKEVGLYFKSDLDHMMIVEIFDEDISADLASDRIYTFEDLRKAGRANIENKPYIDKSPKKHDFLHALDNMGFEFLQTPEQKAAFDQFLMALQLGAIGSYKKEEPKESEDKGFPRIRIVPKKDDKKDNDNK